VLEGELAALVDAHGTWSHGRNEAKCRRTVEHPPSRAPTGHKAPHTACTCGLSGYANRREAETTKQALGAWQPLVLGEVKLWGLVLVGDGAYRAGFARIVAAED
jgi:hypothetical protein